MTYDLTDDGKGKKYDSGKIYILEQRMNKILQKISEVLDE